MAKKVRRPTPRQARIIEDALMTALELASHNIEWSYDEEMVKETKREYAYIYKGYETLSVLLGRPK